MDQDRGSKGENAESLLQRALVGESTKPLLGVVRISDELSCGIKHDLGAAPPDSVGRAGLLTRAIPSLRDLAKSSNV